MARFSKSYNEAWLFLVPLAAFVLACEPPMVSPSAVKTLRPTALRGAQLPLKDAKLQAKSSRLTDAALSKSVAESSASGSSATFGDLVPPSMGSHSQRSNTAGAAMLDGIETDQDAERQVRLNENNARDSEGRTSGNSTPLPIDYSQRYWLGGGYDALNGELRASCLDIENLEFRIYPANHTDDAMNMAVDREELSRKLDLEFNAEASTSWRGAKIEPSFKASILKETSINTTSMVAIARFRHVKADIKLYESNLEIGSERAKDLATDRHLFRERCGDKFVSGVKIGAELIIVVRVEQSHSIQADQTKLNSAIKVGLDKALGMSTSSSLNSEQKTLLKNFRISTHCYSNGATVHVCADNGLNLSGLEIGDTTISDRINKAKQDLADDIVTGKNLSVLDTEFSLYPVPLAERGKAHEEVFFDYRKDLRKVQAWLRLESRIDALCKMVSDIDDQCNDTRALLAEQIAFCADPNLRMAHVCRAPEFGDGRDILDLSDGGTISLYEHGRRRGRQLKLELHELFSPSSAVKAGVLYSLHSGSYGGFADILSDADVSLKNGWQIHFFEHVDGGGRVWTIDESMNGYANVRRKLNDRVSSFRVTRLSNN